MDDDRRLLEALARIEASQAHVRSELSEVKGEQTTIRTTVTQIHHETTVGFGEVKSTIARVDERLSGHMRDDERQFSAVQADVTRAHKKIGGVTAYPAAPGAVKAEPMERTEPMSAAQKAGWIAGILSGLAALGSWLAEHLSAKGG